MRHISFLSFLLATVAWAASEAPPTLRLGDAARPTHYAADLTLSPGETSFSGEIHIDVVLKEPLSLLWLNALGIKVKQASIEAGGTKQPAEVVPGGTDFVGFRTASPVPAGPAKLDIQYTGEISRRASAGVFEGRDAGNRYLFTQFESTDARRAFPCFDEPGFKVPWQLTLHVPSSDLAFTNTPMVSETPEAAGMKKVEFEVSKPLPSYLVAFAVGPFDVVDAGRAGRNHVPLRIIAPKGKAGQAVYMAQVVGPVLDQLENYFGIPYPYAKLDSVALPQTFGFGAMENAGLITYAQTLILADPAVDTDARRRRCASVAAHEMAHQWFGDLVTLAWWDDTWLNEAFATWTSSKVIATWKPEWDSRLEDLGGKFGAMHQDTLVSARQIRQPIQAKDDISNAFDGITYQKGAAVIRMFESWVGEGQFQQGVRSYLRRYEFRNASVNDFLDSISVASEPALTRAFTTFLMQPGVPLVTAGLNCDGAPRLELSQKRLLPLGSQGDAARSWDVPVCVKYPAGAEMAEECFLLDQPKKTFALTKTTTCPAAVVANAKGAGYYVVDYRGGLIDKLLGADQRMLSPVEQRTLLNDLSSLAQGGEIPPAEALKAVPVFAGSPERQVVAQAQALVESMKPYLDPSLEPNFARFVRSSFGARAEKLGWKAAPGDDSETRLARAGLVPFVAREGQDPALKAEASRLAGQWLTDRGGVDADMLGGVLSTAAHFGDRALFDRMLAELNKTQDRQLRQRIIGALGSFRDPGVVKSALDLLIHSDIDLRETAFLLFGPLGSRATDHLPFEFVQANYDALVERAPRGGGFEFGAQLARVGAVFCDDGSRKQFEDFFANKADRFTGGPRIYAGVIEDIHLCQARRQAQGAAIDDFFRQQ